MKRVFLLALAGCGGATSTRAPAPTPMPAPTPAMITFEDPSTKELATRFMSSAPCAIRDRDVTLHRPISLRVHGKPFAVVHGAARLELRAAAVGATVAVDTNDTILVGDVDLAEQHVRPREPLHDGWLGVLHATPGSVNDADVTLDLKLPANVVPTTAPFFRLPCSALTLAKSPAMPEDGTPVWLAQGTRIELENPRGTVVATIETPRVASGATHAHDVATIAARELERVGKHVRIRLGTANYVEGWIDAAKLGSPQQPVTLAAFAAEPARAQPSIVRCPHEVAIYVRDGDVIRVGTYRKNAPIARRDAATEVVPIDLGTPPKLPIEPPGGAPTLEPFVRAEALAGCSASSP